MALIIVLWLMAALTLLLYAFLGEIQVEYSLSGSYADQKKAEQLAWSAIDLGRVSVDNNTQPWQGPNDTTWYHNPDLFYEVPLGDGAFSLLHPSYEGDGKLLWGLEDEASKININVATKAVLMQLPRMTDQIAESIIDWRDANSNAGPNGAENSYYQALNPPYNCKSAPFETVEELLYVAGMTPQVLYGLDQNLNGRIDPGEQYSGTTTTDPGLYGLVTCWSLDRNLTLGGQKRVNVNSANSAQLQQAGLTLAEAQAIQGYILSRGTFASVAHLLGNAQGGVPAVLTKDRFKLVADKLAVTDAATIPGLININTASTPVLLCLPGMTPDLAAKIITARSVPGADLSSLGWLTDVVTPGQLQQFANLVTVHSYQFRIHAIGRIGTPFGNQASTAAGPERPGAMKRMIAVYDRLAKPAPRLVYWKDVTKLGMPYDPTQDWDQTVQQ